MTIVIWIQSAISVGFGNILRAILSPDQRGLEKVLPQSSMPVEPDRHPETNVD